MTATQLLFVSGYSIAMFTHSFLYWSHQSYCSTKFHNYVLFLGEDSSNFSIYLWLIEDKQITNSSSIRWEWTNTLFVTRPMVNKICCVIRQYVIYTFGWRGLRFTFSTNMLSSSAGLIASSTTYSGSGGHFD